MNYLVVILFLLFLGGLNTLTWSILLTGLWAIVVMPVIGAHALTTSQIVLLGLIFGLVVPIWKGRLTL